MIPAAADHVVGDPDSPYLLTDEAARYFRFDRATNGDPRTPTETMRMFREWAQRNRLQPKRRGRTLLWDKRAIDAAMTKRLTHEPKLTRLRAIRNNPSRAFTEGGR